MARALNCSLSGQFPLSSEIFQVIKAQIWIFLVPVVLGLVQVGLFLEETGFFLRQGSSSRRTRLSLWILGVYPVFSITSLIGLFIPRSSFVCNFVASVYHSITLWKFLALIRDFFGGSDQMLKQLEGQRVSPNPFPCCCCCCLPEIAANRSNLRLMILAVYQLSLIRTILFFVTLVLWTDEKYDYGDAATSTAFSSFCAAWVPLGGSGWSLHPLQVLHHRLQPEPPEAPQDEEKVGYTNPNSYINVIMGISTFLSFYGYLLFYKATKPALPGYNLRSKFVCIILVLVLCGLQNGILETMGAVNAIPCSPPLSPVSRSQMIYYYSLAVEMFFIGIFAHYSFRRAEPQPDTHQDTNHRASQTEGAPSGHSSSVCDTSTEAANRGYLCNESLCTIEHSPLDQFDFSVGEPVNRWQDSWRLGSLRRGALRAEGPNPSFSGQRTGVEAPSAEIQIQAQVAKAESEGATVV